MSRFQPHTNAHHILCVDSVVYISLDCKWRDDENYRPCIEKTGTHLKDSFSYSKLLESNVRQLSTMIDGM